MELWTGLVCLVPDPACKDFRRFGDGKGAYVNVVAWSESAKHFEGRVIAIAKELDCIVREMEDVELLESTYNARDAQTSFSRCERLPRDSQGTWYSGIFMSGRKTMRIECDSVPTMVLNIAIRLTGAAI